jgi:hypothetical protein
MAIRSLKIYKFSITCDKCNKLIIEALKTDLIGEDQFMKIEKAFVFCGELDCKNNNSPTTPSIQKEMD